MLDPDLLTEVVFKVSSEDDMSKLAYLNTAVVRRIQILQATHRRPPAAPEAKKEETSVDTSIVPKQL